MSIERQQAHGFDDAAQGWRVLGLHTAEPNARDRVRRLEELRQRYNWRGGLAAQIQYPRRQSASSAANEQVRAPDESICLNSQ